MTYHELVFLFLGISIGLFIANIAIEVGRHYRLGIFKHLPTGDKRP